MAQCGTSVVIMQWFPRYLWALTANPIWERVTSARFGRCSSSRTAGGSDQGGPMRRPFRHSGKRLPRPRWMPFLVALALAATGLSGVAGIGHPRAATAATGTAPATRAAAHSVGFDHYSLTLD